MTEINELWAVPPGVPQVHPWQPIPPGHHNPHETFSVAWFAWKELNEFYFPYHVGTTPSGQPCSAMPRVEIARPGVFRCPRCGKQFPTAVQELFDTLTKEGGQEDLLAHLRARGGKYLSDVSRRTSS